MRYREYISGPEWRHRRRAFLAKFPTCNRCGMSLQEHKSRFDVALHVHHVNYARLGAELDEDLETICENCHAIEEQDRDPTQYGDYLFVTLGVGQKQTYIPTSGTADDSTIDFESPSEAYWNTALERINKRIRLVANCEPSEEVWQHLERMHRLEALAQFCKGES